MLTNDPRSEAGRAKPFRATHVFLGRYHGETNPPCKLLEVNTYKSGSDYKILFADGCILWVHKINLRVIEPTLQSGLKEFWAWLFRLDAPFPHILAASVLIALLTVLPLVASLAWLATISPFLFTAAIFLTPVAYLAISWSRRDR